MEDKIVKELELKIQVLTKQIASLKQQVELLKRENNRAKSSITQIANHINRR
jgi:outer membrane murein-binding lipoprotein Lpp